MIDLVLQSGTRLALHQWLNRRGLGTLTQDETTGEWRYRHTADGAFIWWRHPSGVLEATAPTLNSEGEVTQQGTYYNGFWGILRFREEISVVEWIQDNTSVVNQQGFPGYGGEGITVVTPEKINEHLDNIGLPKHEFLGGCQWSDPRAWYDGPAMVDSLRVFDDVTYRSLIDYNVWSPTQYPQGWELVEQQEPDEPSLNEWTTGVSYSVSDRVTYNGQTYECRQAHTSIAGWNPAAVPALWLQV